MNFRFLHFCLACALLLPGLARTAFAAPEYGVPVDIGALSGGQHFSQATGINNSGLVCGYSQTSDLQNRAFVYSAANGLQDLGTLPGGIYSEANAVNDSGQVAGDSSTASNQDHLFLWDSAHGMQGLGQPAGSNSVIAAGINASSQICGYFETSPNSFVADTYAFVYSGGTFYNLGVPSGYVSSQATGINASGLVCGYLSDASYNTAAFVHSGTGPLTAADILTLPQGFSQGQAYSINTAGQVAGVMSDSSGSQYLFLYSGGTVTNLGLAGGTNASIYASTVALNNSGQLAGGIGTGGFVYTIASGVYRSVTDSPNAINDAGHTAGYMMSTYNYTHASLDETDIGALPGGSDSVGLALNASGQIAGASRTDGDNTHAVLADAQGLHDLGTLRTATQPHNASKSKAYAINSGGQIAGYSLALSYGFHAFLYDAAHGMQDLGALSRNGGSFAFGLNDAGQVVGYSGLTGGATHAFLYTASGGMQDLGTLPGGTNSSAQAINNAGQVVGQSDTGNGAFHAFLYTASGGMQDIGALPGGTTSQANAINAVGQIVGSSDLTGGATHAFLYAASGGMQDLGTLPGGTYSIANGINASGQVVGYADTSGGERVAFLWDSAHGMRDLNALLPPGGGFTLSGAAAINDKGQITGYGVNAQGQTHGFLLTSITHATHLLWSNTDHRAMFWDVNPDGSFTVAAGYGPYTDSGANNLWTATALATGPDGVSHILWNNSDHRVMLWNVKSDGTFTVIGGYGPYTDQTASQLWSAVGLSVGPDNVMHLLWDNTDHRAMFWDVNQDGSFTVLAGYGPYTDGAAGNLWDAVGISTGPDNLSHLLWSNSDKRAMFWDVSDSDGSFSVKAGYGPYTDNSPQNVWDAVGVSTGPDNVSHLLWNNSDLRAMFWDVSGSDGSFSVLAGYGPYTDNAPGNTWSVTGLATGADNVSHLLWDNADHRAMLWDVSSSDGSFTVKAGYGPYTDNAPSNLWSAVSVSAGP